MQRDDAENRIPTTPVPPEGWSDVEQRMERLEDAVAALCDTQSLEDRIAERVAQKLTQHEIQLPPMPVKVKPQPLPPAAPLAAFAELPEAAAGTPPARKPNPGLLFRLLPETSLLHDLAWDARTFVRLMRDPGYQTTWSFRTLPLAILAYVFILPKVAPYLGWLVPQVSLGIVGLLLDVVLLYLAFKFVQRELRRYDEFARKYRT